MRSILEFALFAWVGISIVAVFVQLVRIARFKRANRSTPPGTEPAAPRERPTIDLDKRLASTAATNAPDTTPTVDAPSAVMAGAPSVNLPDTTADSAAVADATPAPVAEAAAPSPAPSVTAPSPAPTAEAAPTLADLLAGVRLPWNLLPTVDQSREPSNDRVALITAEGEPGDIGVDVADELERLGFTIAPRGDDTALATRDGHALGLQIIEEPMAAEVDGVRRFPTATEASVALDIWIETNNPQ